jgi:hypothetical protein
MIVGKAFADGDGQVAGAGIEDQGAADRKGSVQEPLMAATPTLGTESPQAAAGEPMQSLPAGQ